MITRDLSLAGAVALVGVGLLAKAGVQWAVATQRVAVAEDRKPSEAAARDDTGDIPPAVDGTTPAMPIGGDDGCVEGEPIGWFGAIRELPQCGLDPGERWPSQSIGAADVNGDGVMEYFGEAGSGLVAEGGRPSIEECSVVIVESGPGGHPEVVVTTCVVPESVLSSWILGDPAWTGSIYVEFGWRDMDVDADLDLVVTYRMFGAGPFRSRHAWLENTGFEATQPLVGDLDGDGAVGASDLTMLLGGWTGT